MGENKTLADALRVWVSSFKDSGVVTVPTDTLEDLRDGVALMEIMCELECEVLPKEDIRYNTKGNPNVIERNLDQLVDAVDDFYQNYLFLEMGDTPDVSLIGDLDTPISEASDELAKLMEIVLGAAVQCTDRQDYIEGIMKLEASTQEQLMEVIQTMMARFEDMGQFSDLSSARQPSAGNASIGSNAAEITRLLETNEELEKNVAELQEKVLELEAEAAKQEDSSQRDTAALDELNEMNVKLTERYEETERQLDELRAESESATRENQAQIRKLNKDLEKEAQAKAKAIASTQALKDEIEQLTLQAKEAKTLKEREAQYTSKFEALESQHKEALNKLKSEIETLKADGQRQLKDQTAASNDREEDRIRLDELKQDLAEANKRSEELSEKVAEYEAEKTEHTRNYAELERKLEEMNDQMSLAPAGTDLGALAGSVAAATGLTSASSETNEASTRKITALEEKNKVLEEEKDALKVRVKNINTKARSAVSDRDAKIKDLEARIETLSHTAQTPVAETSAGADATRSTQDSLQRHASNEVDSAREINDLLQEKNKLQAELIQAENALRKQQEESAHLQKALEREINQGVGKDYESMVLNMKNELVEKDATIAAIKARAEQEANRSETEMQLMTSAWFTLGCSVQRASITDRNGGRGPRSFLERQRDLLANKTSIASSSRR